jgi:transcriptional regulator with XRE-family HTH domain
MPAEGWSSGTREEDKLLAELLFRIRLKEKITQAALAERSGLGRGTISHFENTRHCPPWVARKYAEGLGCKLTVELTGPRWNRVPDLNS